MIKRDGEHQRFNREKLRAALLGAAHKRPVDASDIEAIVDRVELAAATEKGELSSERVGELVSRSFASSTGAPICSLREPCRPCRPDRPKTGLWRGRFRPRRARGCGVQLKCRSEEGLDE